MTLPPILLPPILLIGGGKMGGAMLAGWAKLGLAPSIVVDPASAAHALSGPGVKVVPDISAVPDGFVPAAVVLAVKPQQADAVLPGLARFGGVKLSIMAGRTVASLPGPVVRAMPNTPAAISQGITAAFAGPGVDDAQRTLCDSLLESVGDVVWLDDEGLMDAVTAISGGGPAYVFLLAELLERAGVEQGLPPAVARHLARRTVAGSGALLGASTEDTATLRFNVTSPAGTTERALAVLMADGAWPTLVPRAIAAATARSRELASA